ncbi:hypothetical protein [Salinimicrobium xinjiangense]|uniref:hypothetical protein n=1 Tax=Salinimicrobium xinjiangense TaxID=438596 RepID=UPI000424279D|nr:hypothetical protein [Salinimicrobium xinjiangense]
MIRKIVFFLFIICSYEGLSQSWIENYNSAFSSQEKVVGHLSSYEVEFKDVRQFDEYQINPEQLQNYILGFSELLLEGETSGIKPDLTQVKPKKIIVDLEFYNLTEGSSNKAILKAIASISLIGGGYSTLDTKFNISAEEFTSINLKNVQKAKHSTDLESLIENFSKKFAKKIVERIVQESEGEEHLIFEITSIGTANKSSTIEETKEKAALVALVRASEMAFGTKVTNTSEIVDFGDVSDVVLSEAGGIVLSHEIIEDSVKITEDGHCALMVKSLIMKK